MSARRILLPLLVVCSVLALTLRVFVRRASAKLAGGAGPYDAIDDYVERQMNRLNIPGASLAVVAGDQIVHLRGFGRARPHGSAPSPQTPFVLGSTTKSFTAMAVMQLVEAGKMAVDAPVQRYLPWFCIADPRASAQMTVRHLLNQTSGLPNLPGSILLTDFDPSPGASERQMRALSTLKLTRPVGAKFEYSNLNYILLGLIVEAVSDESYEDYVRRHIFAPLEMKHSYTSQADAMQDGLAVGHRYWFGFPVAVPNLPIPRCALPGGELISSAEDMAHYLIANLNGGRYGSAQVLSPAGIDEMHRGAADWTDLGAAVGKYGMGWVSTDLGPTRAIWHDGTVPDFSSYMALLPEQRKGLVLLANADHGLPMVLSEVGLSATALLAGQQLERSAFGFILYLPWAMRSLLLIPLLQVAGILSTLRLLRRWRSDPVLVPGPGRIWLQHILLPLIPNLSLAAVPVLLQSRNLLRFILLFMPDLGWTALLCGGLAGVWSLIRTGLLLRAVREL